ncbi:Crp/Fnr family transcriptional regulator [Streptomyces sp. NPDC050617]|uniref:Crp/Fnr family transcriptional regulator n=1 Tax=Streptomyces sp. NPDC050617 TaxID=3154628 RepID=UPI003415BF33
MMHASNIGDHVPFLNTLSNEACASFALLGSRRSYGAGAPLIHEGEQAQELMVLHEGVAKVTARLDGGRAALMDIRIAGDVVGELAAVDLGPRSATVTACGDVVATVVPRHELLPFLLTNPDMALALNRVLCGRLRRSDRRRLEFGGYPVLVRVARVLVELAEQYGRPGRKAEFKIIDVNLSQSEFASLTGCTTHTVRKALAELRDSGHITTGARKTEVLDQDGLRKVARLSVSKASTRRYKAA